MLALRLSHTTCEVAEFVGYWSQVSDLDLTSFLLQTCKRCAFTRPITMEFFSTGEAIEHVGRMMRDFGRCWYFPSWLARKNGQMILYSQ